MQPSPLTIFAPLQITCLLVLTLLALPIASAQDLDGASINARVVDQDGAVIAGASITATLNRTGVMRKATHLADARFVFRQLEPGTYTLRITADGLRQTIGKI